MTDKVCLVTGATSGIGHRHHPRSPSMPLHGTPTGRLSTNPSAYTVVGRARDSL